MLIKLYLSAFKFVIKTYIWHTENTYQKSKVPVFCGFLLPELRILFRVSLCWKPYWAWLWGNLCKKCIFTIFYKIYLVRVSYKNVKNRPKPWWAWDWYDFICFFGTGIPYVKCMFFYKKMPIFDIRKHTS